MQNNIFSGLFVGQNLVVLKQVDSTNTYLKNILSNSKPVTEGTVIMAEDQYAGRGQQQNSWHTEAGKNLTFSLLLKPSFLQVSQQFELNRIVSLGVANALANAANDDVLIKWPNDIYWRDKKLGGILIENIVQGSRIKNSVIGIGLNINQESFQPDVPNPVSLKQILHKDYDLHLLLSDICSYIEAFYLQMKAGHFAPIKAQYLQKLYWFNQPGTFSDGVVDFTGTITGVTDEGLLLLNVDGKERSYNFKEIKFLIHKKVNYI